MKVFDYRTVEATEEKPGVQMRVVIGAKEGAPRFVMRVFETRPGCHTPLHSHWWEHEVFVFSGKGVVHGESGETEIQAGSVVFIEPNEQHCFSNVGDDVLRFVCLIPLVEEGSGQKPASE